MTIKVRLSYGDHVVLDFKSVTFALDTGQPIEFEEILRVTEECWSEGNSNTGKQVK